MGRIRCGFCRRYDHNVTSCPRLKKIEDRFQVRLELKMDTIRQMMHLISLLRADVDFMKQENQLIYEENVRLHAWLEILQGEVDGSA